VIGLGRGYGRRQIDARCSTILKIINALSKTSYNYTQLQAWTKIQRNVLRTLLNLLVSEGMIKENNYSSQREGYRGNRKYYVLSLSHPIISAVAANKGGSKINVIEQLSNLILKNNKKSTDRLDGNNTFLEDNDKQESSRSVTKMSLIQPLKDQNPNVISKQFEYLIEDMKYYNGNFLKRYYPPEEHRPYYAYAIRLMRQLFRPYTDNRYHRDLYDWSEIYLADKGLHPSGKSAKELSARYGERIRRYNKWTGEPIFGRKGISKKHIQRKSLEMAEFLKEFYTVMPLFFVMHHLFKNKKEKLIVDHVIDRKQVKDIRKR
jgi:hypothetical protein